MLNNAKKNIQLNSIFDSIFLSKKLFIQRNYSFICLRIIHSKKLFLKNYSFKNKFIQKKLTIIHSKQNSFRKNENYSLKKLFI